MKKTILTLVMMLTMTFAATAAPVVKAQPASKTHVALKGDSIVVTDGDEELTVSGIPQKVRDKINEALDDTLTAGEGTTVEIEGYKGELSPEDFKYMSDHWGEVVKQISYASILGLLALVGLVLLFRFLNRRNKYRVIEKAIINNYPLNELSLNDSKHSAIYVQQPVYPSTVSGSARAGQQGPVAMSAMPNWRALMPAVKWMAWGIAFTLFGLIDGFDNPFWPIGLALIFVGVCKGYILHKEQKVLQQAWDLNGGGRQPEPMREGIPVPPPMDNDYKEDDTYQPY